MEFKENALTVEIYRELHSSGEWKNSNIKQTENALSRSLYSIVVFDEDNPAGMGRVVGDGIYNTVCDVIVKPDYQRKGIGTGIMNQLLKYLEDQILENEKSSVQLIAEKGKESFYKRFGFESVPNEFSGSGMRKIICK